MLAKNGKAFIKIAAVTFGFAYFFSTAARGAWDGAPTGVISTIDVTAGTNYGLRVALTSGSSMCAGGPTWAYLNEADSNYKIYVATLMLARAQGSKVTVYSNLESGYCHIGYLILQPN